MTTPWRETTSPAGEAPEARVANEVGALKEWQRQIHAGQRTVYTLDALLKAAILEAHARDEIKIGQLARANKDRLEAAALLVEAA